MSTELIYALEYDLYFNVLYTPGTPGHKPRHTDIYNYLKALDKDRFKKKKGILMPVSPFSEEWNMAFETGKVISLIDQ